ncbi:MAG: hypothetical protein WBM90_08140 [Acidimicrobiia bacterium]
MRSHDVELIAALVEGRLEDETEARALVASSHSHRAEYEAQRVAYDAMSAIPGAELTEHERATLHRDVWTELRAQPRAEKRPVPWYYRWSYGAAGLFVIVGLVFVINQSSGSDDSSGETAFTEAGSALDRGLDESTPTTTAAATATDAGSDGGAAPAEESPVVAEAPDLPQLEELASKTRRGVLESEDLGATNFDSAMLDEMTKCIETAGLVDHEIVGDIETENHYIVAVPANLELTEETPVSFVNADTCELVLTDS